MLLEVKCQLQLMLLDKVLKIDYKSYAVLTIHSESKIELQYFDMKHQPLEGLHYEYQLDAERGFIHD